MKKLLFAVIATIVLGIAIPANAQVFVGADRGGAGVRVGPFGIGVGPDYWGGPRYYRDYAYLPACRLERTRIVTPSGNIIWQTHRVCD